MTFSTPKYHNQPTCYNCQRAFSISMPQTSDSGSLRDTQKPVALLVWPDEGHEEKLLAHNSHEGKKALEGPVLEGPVRTHLTYARSPQFGIISPITSSYLRELVFKTDLFSSGVICVARQ